MAARLVGVDVRDMADAVTLSALFAGLTVAVVTANTRGADESLRRRQRHPRRGARHDLARGVRVVVQPRVQIPVAAVVTCWLRWARVPGANAVLAATMAVFLADKGCKMLVRRPRPPGYHGDEPDESFPSGHTAATAALTLTLARLLERGGVVRAPLASAGAVFLTLLVAETRLVLDDHWPSDVLAGALLGAATARSALALTRPRVPRTAPRNGR